MDKKLKRDLILSGSGSAVGGTFHRVRINGSGEINGDMECIDLKINGSAQLQGNVKAESASIHGSSVIAGNLVSNKVKIQGHTDIDGDLTGKDIKVQGNSRIKGSLSAEEIRIEGGVSIGGDCEAEVFLAKGSFTIGGLLNAGEIEIKLYGGCQAKEIGGEKITVKKPGIAHKLKRFIFSYIFRMNVDLAVESIEGDEIYLEYTKARFVRGNNVTLGPGCEVELVEYKNQYQQAAGVKVHDKKQI